MGDFQKLACTVNIAIVCCSLSNMTAKQHYQRDVKRKPQTNEIQFVSNLFANYTDGRYSMNSSFKITSYKSHPTDKYLHWNTGCKKELCSIVVI